jgi:hypothetical protein
MRCAGNKTGLGVRVIDIDEMSRLLIIVKMANILILFFMIDSFAGLVVLAFSSPIFAVITIPFLIVPAFAARLAWKNLDLGNAVVQRWTIRSLILFATTSVAASALGYLVFNDADLNDQEETFGLLAGAFYQVLIGLIALLSALAVFLVRRRTVHGLDIRLVDLMRFVISDHTVGVAHKVPPKHKWRGRLLVGGGLLTMVVANGVLDSTLIGSFFSVLVRVLAFFMLLYGRACFQPSAQTLLKADPRSPVLLLRSFIDDQRIKLRRAPELFMDFSLESRIATYFSKIGPFIAVSSPKDHLPVIGAARAALDETEWQGRVIEWMESSCLLVVMAGATHWVAWELREVVERGHIEKLIILFPDYLGKGQRHLEYLHSQFECDRQMAISPADRLATIVEAVRGTPWDIALREIKDPWSIRSLVFDDDGHVSMVAAKSLNRNSYYLAAVIAHFLILRRRVGQQLAPISRIELIT